MLNLFKIIKQFLTTIYQSAHMTNIGTQ